MTEQEKLKLAQIIAKRLCPNHKSHFNLYGDKANCYSRENFAECQTVTDTVDDLIAAGLTFDGEYKKLYEKEKVISQSLRGTSWQFKGWYEEQKHKAEVAERALKICLIDNLGCCDCDTRFYKKCKGTDKDKEECAMLDIDDYIQQAEKELAERKNNEG